ncbi:DUF2169 family type VI secretion system accessory protein [Desulfonatronum thioautotrophicum]|uniref:DUF2169 family type VI secretion system accessory protein n=1 Tax=Desulfonatronum thioautotrophicum TaxID=617001 RepID=UPI00069C59F2|nr:DUF2169 domain-containing protein [Desulfonatronum thioautotrophicum]
MKVIKPDTLSLLFAVHPRPTALSRSAGHHEVVFGAMAGFTLGGGNPDQLLPEDELWRHIQQSLPEDESLDSGLAKPRSEFLVYGACCARNPVRGKEVLVQVGGLRKRLHVFGPRFWRAHGPSTPRPFTRIPLNWRHAYGGPDYPDNPQGLGHIRLARGVHPLPLVELPGQFVAFPRQKAQPAGLTAIPAQWPVRKRLFGRVNTPWLERCWPGPPQDQTPEFACVAPLDQRFQGFLRGGESFLIQGMHPGKEVLQGHLPTLRTRIFVLRQSEAGPKFFEVPCHPETVWLFPEAETGVVLFRGVAGTRDEECGDITATMVAVEERGQKPRPVEAYHQECLTVLGRGATARTNLDVTAQPPPSASAAKAATPRAVGVGLVAGGAVAGASSGSADLSGLVAALEQEVDDYLEAIGVSPEQAEGILDKAAGPEAGRVATETSSDHPESSGSAESFEAMLQELRETTRAVEVETATLLGQQGLDPEAVQGILGEATLAAEGEEGDTLAGLEELMAREHLPPEVRQGIGSALSGFQDIQAALAVLAAKLGAPPASRPAKPPSDERAVQEHFGRLTTEQALKRHRRGLGLAGLDLSACDFAGHDLAGADLRRAVLDNVSWPGVNLAGADLSGALARNADLSGADLQRAKVLGADFEGARMVGVKAMGCVAVRARLQGTDLRQADLRHADLTAADCTRADLQEAILEKVLGRELRVNGADLRKARFTGADLSGSRADAQTNGTQADMQVACLRDARWAGAMLFRADFSRAELTGADLSRADLQEVNFFHATARGIRLSKARLCRARLVGVDLFQAVLRRADCTGARVENVNLFGADLYRCVLDRATLLALRSRSDVNLGRTLLQPGLMEQRA